MKLPILLLIPLLLFNILSCNENKNGTNPSSNDSIPTTPITAAENIKTPNNDSTKNISYYISARSGLNYRVKPKGKVLGKFLLNEKVEVVKHTTIFEEIKDGNKLIKGEWVGTQLGKDTVYVFDAFLSTTKVEQEIVKNNSSMEGQRIFYPKLSVYQPYEYEISKGKQALFVSLSEIYPLSEHPDSLAISDKYLGSKKVVDNHTLDKKYSTRFLKSTGISETDNLYIYCYSLDTVITYQVKDLPVMAHLSPYTQVDQMISQYDYMIGFDLGKKLLSLGHNYYYNSFIYVGEENPFVTDNIQPMIWEKTDNKSFPAVNLSNETFINLRSYDSNETYKFTAFDLNYYARIYISKDHGARAMHLVVKTNENKIVLNEVLFEGESASLSPLSYVGKKNTPEQWTGKIFKDKPPVLFGFVYESFDCPGIYVTGKHNGYIRIRCDNRH